MKTTILALLVLIFFLPGHSQDGRMDDFISDLMSRMTIEEKIGQLNLVTAGSVTTGNTINRSSREKIRAGMVGAILNDLSVSSIIATQDITKESRHRIPILFGMDVIHGYRTIFPIPLAMSCTWDMELVEKSARLAAAEATANGIAWTYSPMADIARDPRWGRIAEGAGEDPYIGSLYAEALVRGYQGADLSLNNTMLACVKHFALYGASEAGRDYNTVDMSRVAMYNYYLPPYKAAIDAGAGSVMTSFNVVDGIPATGNRWLLTTLLRDQWGFRGFVVTDYTSINEMTSHGLGDLERVSALALKAGTDMDMVGEGFLTTLSGSLSKGTITEEDINRACRRVLEAKYRLGLFDDPYRYASMERAATETLTGEHIAAALEFAERSMVLLKNDSKLLPLSREGTIAVIGPLADSRDDLLGTWSMGGNPDDVVTILEGIRKAGGNARIVHEKGCVMTDHPLLSKAQLAAGPHQKKVRETTDPNDQLLKTALETAREADVIVAVLGERAGWSGEAASMTSLGLQKVQQELLQYLVSTGKPVVLVLVNGRPMTLEWENNNVTAILETWNGGVEAGTAVARILFGDYNPSGKLTTTFPANVGQIPLYYNHLGTGRPADEKNKYTSKYLDSPNEPVYPFGFGLSYTSFSYGEIELSRKQLRGNDSLVVSFTLENTGHIAGEEVVQLYIRDPVASISRPVRELKDFRKVKLEPGESTLIGFVVTVDDLKFYNSELVYDWEPGEFIIQAGPNSRDVKEVTVSWEK